MSVRIMTQVWATDLPNAGNKIVLLALADNANDEGTCYPSLSTLARKCSMTARSVRRNLRDLEAAGLVRSEDRYGRSTVYTLDLSRAASNDGACAKRAPKAPKATGNTTSDPGQNDLTQQDTPVKMSGVGGQNVLGWEDKMSGVGRTKCPGWGGQNVRVGRTKCPGGEDKMSPITIIEPSGEPKEEKNTVAVATDTPPDEQPRASRNGKPRNDSDATREANRATWQSYCAAYVDRYGVEPVRNARVNRNVADLVGRLGATEAPAVAGWYLTHNGSDYVRAQHSVGMLLAHCEGLRTQWATGRRVTTASAKQVDQTQTNHNAATDAVEILRRRHANG